ncbi:MAG: AI-2E family transporter [Saprospiraceae bacterium]
MALKPTSIKTQVHPNTIRQLFFLGILILLGWIIASELYFMIGSFFGAVTLYVILMYPMKYLVIIKKWPSWITALLLMTSSFVIMVLPLVYTMSIAADRIMALIDRPEAINQAFDQVHQYLFSNFQVDILNPENVKMMSDQVITFGKNTLGSTFMALGNVFLMYLVLYFMLVETRAVEKWLRLNIPFKSRNVKRIITDVKNLVYSNAIGIPIVAFIQGIVGLIGYWIFGVEEFLLMGILTAICSVIPIVGTLVVYLPLAIYQLAVVGTWEGIGVALWGFIVIGSVDNIARFLVQKKLADVHPLITLLGVIIGINLFGFIGVIFGPLMLAVFFMLMRIYVDEFGKVDANRPDELKVK